MQQSVLPTHLKKETNSSAVTLPPPALKITERRTDTKYSVTEGEGDWSEAYSTRLGHITMYHDCVVTFASEQSNCALSRG
jgi:hypothetical protein